jgi:hypothetical protein
VIPTQRIVRYGRESPEHHPALVTLSPFHPFSLSLLPAKQNPKALQIRQQLIPQKLEYLCKKIQQSVFINNRIMLNILNESYYEKYIGNCRQTQRWKIYPV